MAKWICASCNYRFESENPMDCPYCGRREGLEKEKGAEELVDEVGRLLEN